MKKTKEIIFFLIYFFFFCVSGFANYLPKTIKITDHIPYKEHFFYIPDKHLFLFGIKGGFVLFNEDGKFVKKFVSQNQSPAYLVDTLNFFIKPDCYYVVGLLNILKLDKNLKYKSDLTRGNSYGMSVCWIDKDESYFAVTTFSGLKHFSKSGKLLDVNTALKKRIDKNHLSQYFNLYTTYVNYPYLYVVHVGNLMFYKVDLRNLKILFQKQLKYPENFKSAFKYDRNVNIGLNINKYIEETRGFGYVWACFVSEKNLFIAWKISGTGKGFVDVYQLPSCKRVRQLKLQDCEEGDFVRMRFHPTKPILYDYDYIESEDGNDYGLIRVYDLEKAIKGEE